MAVHRRLTPVLIPNPPALWHPILAHCHTLMRDLGAPANLIDGRPLDTALEGAVVRRPFGLVHDALNVRCWHDGNRADERLNRLH